MISKQIKNILTLLRPYQWYKNTVVFLAIFFSGNLFDFIQIKTVLVAFVSLALISSSGYIINDIFDRKKDRLHPEKRKRPIAAGIISVQQASITSSLVLIISLLLASLINLEFMLLASSVFLLTLIYTLFLKKIVIADVLTIAILFVIRAIAGAVAISVLISPWLILVPFFLSLFLSVGKRHGDLLLGVKKSRKVLKDYTLEFTHSMMVLSTTLLIMSYALYSFLSNYNYLIYSLPFAIFLILRYYLLILQNSPISRHPEKVFQDKSLVIGLLVWLIITTLLIYG